MSSSSVSAELAGFGAFFAVDVHDAPPGGPWRPLAELVEDAAVLRARVDAVRGTLARGQGRDATDVELRVAASTAHLGLVARLVAPAVAVAALGSRSLDLTLDGLWWQDRLGAPFPLSVPSTTQDGPPALVGSALEAITDLMAREFGVAGQVLWGNVGSAANTAARLIAQARPDLALGAATAADLLLADPRVDGGTLRAGPAFRRRSCCLIYRIGGGRSAVCGDCVLIG